ncbi:DUF397 domain-containing protein [Streptomycetaceae bacterium NBC_01309]
MTIHGTGLLWRKSSYSGNQGGECVEVASLTPAVGVRDTKDRSRGVLTVPAPSWASLTASLGS